MADVICRVCGEPWEVYHLRHDAPAWVMPLVLAGAGCESCEGVPPDEESLGYSRPWLTGPGAWLDNRTISFDAAHAAGLIEIDGDTVLYLTRHRTLRDRAQYTDADRAMLADALRRLRREIKRGES